jgi:N-acetylmuramic acid 6-phosphate etherase
MSNVQTKNIKLRERAVGILMAECGLDEAAAKTALEATEWNLPIALVMRQARVSREAAEAALRDHQASVARAIAALTS